jgi:undecaprenyl-diphosphatase
VSDPRRRYLSLERSPFEVGVLIRLTVAGLVLLGIGLLLHLPLAGEPPAFDAEIAARATAPAEGAAAEAAAAIGRIGHLTIVSAVAVVIAVVAWRRSGRFDVALLLTAVLGGATVLTGLLKVLTDRARPDDTLTLSAAFPSGHTVRGVAVLGLVAWIVRQWSRRSSVQQLAIPVAVVLVLVNGAARVVLGVHWPTDVAAGFLLGAAWLLVCCSLLRPRLVATTHDQVTSPSSASSSSPSGATGGTPPS